MIMASSENESSGEPHKLTPDGMIAVVKAMDDPQYIIYQPNDRYVEIVPVITSQGNKVFAIIEIGNNKNQDVMNGYEGGLYNVWVSAFPPKQGVLKDYLSKKGNIIIYDKTKNGNTQRGSGSRVPSLLNESPFFVEDYTTTSPESQALFEKKSENSEKNPDKRQERAKSNREILSEALESATQNEIEAKRLAEYKSKVEQADELQAHLSELRDRIFSKAPVLFQ